MTVTDSLEIQLKLAGEQHQLAAVLRRESLLREKLSDCEQGLNASREELAVYKQANADLIESCAEKFDLLTAAQSELTALKAELASEEQDHAELRDVVAALREENERLKSESFEGLYNEAIGNLDALREELAIVNREKNDVAYRANETAKKLNSMTISKATMRNQLKQKLAQTQQRLTATEQRNAELERDKIRIDWLIEQPVDTLYLDDGRIIDIAGRIDLRDAIDEAMAKPTESGASE